MNINILYRSVDFFFVSTICLTRLFGLSRWSRQVAGTLKGKIASMARGNRVGF